LAFAVSNLPELIHEGPDGNGLLFSLPEGMESIALDTRGHSFGLSLEENGDCGEGAPLAAMATALAELAQKPEKREAMGRAGRRLAMRYAQTICMDAVEELLR
jgi:glycosyltransferase involved in cell wall biosynthesis